MQKFKHILKSIFCLSPFLTVIIALPSFALVIYALAFQPDSDVISYLAYFLSAYALILCISGIIRMIRLGKEGICNLPHIHRLLSNSFISRYLKDVSFRTGANLGQGFLMNILYAAMKMGLGLYYQSIWFLALSIYYFLLAFMRVFLFHYMKKKNPAANYTKELRRYRACGGMLLVMNEALVAIIVLIVQDDGGFVYPGVLVYAMAAYSFYAVILAIVSIINFRKLGSPVMSASKVINLTAALVSMLSLETALLTQFGQMDSASFLAFRHLMLSLSGGVISLIVLGMAFYMIIHASRILKNTDLIIPASASR